MHKIIYPILVLFLVAACSSAPQQLRPSTAHSNVSVLEEKFIIDGLDRERLIRIYLPENYKESDERYPVLYAHDGQNLFDDSTSYSGEWGLDEALNQLATESDFKLIVVGIDNGGEYRMNELSPWENDDYLPAQGEEYMSFIVEQVKPYIDQHFRTLSDRENTGIMGSSMGGLISHYAIYRYPTVFSKAIIFSPSYWFSEDVFSLTNTNPVPQDSRLWLEIGRKEGNAVDDVEKMHAIILATEHPANNTVFKIDPEGKHHESSWRKQFPAAVTWLFAK